MNTLIFFLAGVSIGLVTDKLYHSFAVIKKQPIDAEKEEETEAIEDKLSEREQINESEIAGIEKTESTRVEDIPGQIEERHDDLSQLKGVGPKLVVALNEINIYNYEQLCSSPIDMLLEQLRATGGRFSRPAISSIVERAQLAANNK